MPILTRRLPNGNLEITATADDGAVELIVTVKRPTYHGLLIAHLMNWQDDARELDSGPRPWVEPIRFPTERCTT